MTSGEQYILQGYESISQDEIERRTQFAKMRQLEIGVLKDELMLADKAGELCRIDVALNEFDAFLVDFVRLLRQMPDHVQTVIPEMTPEQYKSIQELIDNALQRLSEKRLHLTIESTHKEKHDATQARKDTALRAAKKK